MEPHSARAHFNLARSRKSSNPKGDIARLRELLKKENLNQQQQVLLHFAIRHAAVAIVPANSEYEALSEDSKVVFTLRVMTVQGPPSHD